MPRRPQIYDAKDLAVATTKRFKDRDVEYIKNFRFKWPAELHYVGDSLAVAYASDKWKPKNESGKREFELYKHLAESRNRAYVAPGLLCDYHSPRRKWGVMGPMVEFSDVPMPREFSILGLFEEVDLELFTHGTDENPEFSGGDDGIVKVTVRHGMLGGGHFLWSKIGKGKNEPFIFVYTKAGGICMILTGDELDILKDGIVG